MVLYGALILAGGIFSWSMADYRHRRLADHARLRHLATRDSLTSAWNRRSLFELGNEAIERALSGGGDVSLIMLDVDHFKMVNDTHGHAAGDMVLKELVERMKIVARAFDAVSRYGGEEFAILSPRTDLQGAFALAERLRQAIEEKPFSIGDKEIAVTASLGVAQFGPSSDELISARFEDLAIAADTALYAAKRNGRNRVELPPPHKPAASLLAS